MQKLYVNLLVIINHMDVLELNKKAWDEIGKKTASPYIKHKKYLEVFNLFCNKLPKNAPVLDFGCGPGLPFTKELVKRGFEVTAIDISDTMIEEAITLNKYFKLNPSKTSHIFNH
jgi:2-polyprenyl-3-methyl-5-hydroxy-6-metoxy-1,4-benzoquinol methylase